MLLIGSTPYARKGILYDGYQEYYGADCPEVLCWQAPTLTMNPSYSRSLIDRELTKDPAKNRSEYLAVFRDDIEDFLSRDALEGCIVPSMRERGPRSEFRYVAFADPAGGGADAYTLAVTHKEGDSVVLDCVRERCGSPEAITREYAALLRTYRIASVVGDDYGAQWVKEAFSRHGVTYESSRLSRSEIYLNFLPLIHSRRVELLDGSPKMLNQLLALERRTTPSGGDV